MRSGLIDPQSLVCLERVSEIKGITEENGRIHIGAGTVFSEILEHPLTRKQAGVLVKAVQVLGAPSIRHMGTIGGNICTASPAGDTLPALTVLGAELDIASKRGVRHESIKDFIRGPGQTTLRPGEILTGISLAGDLNYNIHHFEKVGLRNALAIAVVSLAAVVRVSGSGLIKAVSLAWGSVGPTVVVLPEVEKLMTGRKLEMDVLMGAAALVREGVTPIDDVRASARYRRTVAGNLVLRLLNYAPAADKSLSTAREQG
jgi:xanthine dehydrogenase FAD-binding subunit